MIEDLNIPCPECGKHNFTPIRKFNLMFKTFQGVTEDSSSEIYLRPETAQGIFVNFNNVLRTTRRKLPMGIAQVGKSFRNEITPGNFTFRTREFEQMELEFFCKPGDGSGVVLLLAAISATTSCCPSASPTSHLRLRDHSPEELSHYSNGDDGHRVHVPLRLGRTLGHRRPHGFRLEAARQVLRRKVRIYGSDDEREVRSLLRRAVARSSTASRSPSFASAYRRGRRSKTATTAWSSACIPHLAPFKAAVLPLQKNKLGALAREESTPGAFRRLHGRL